MAETLDGPGGGIGAPAPAWKRWVGGAAVTGSRARVRLFCFPHAGGGAGSFRVWVAAFPPEVDVRPVRLPGREDRWREPPVRRMPELVERLAAGVHPLLDRPFALFGHSMGAFAAFEFARRVRRLTGETPVHLFVASARAPHLPSLEPPLSPLSDAAFVARLARLGELPPTVLRNPDLMQVVLPALRADAELCESYAPAPEAPLDCPVTVFGGGGDPGVPPSHLRAWKAHTTGPFRLQLFPGGHFFIVNFRARVVSAILGGIMSHLAGQHA